MNTENRSENIEELAEVLKKFGENDIRVGQAIYNVVTKSNKDLFNIENSKLVKLLEDELVEIKKV